MSRRIEYVRCIPVHVGDQLPITSQPRPACDTSIRMFSKLFQVGDLIIDVETGIAKRGLLVRHLVLPNDQAGTAAIAEFLATNLGNSRPIARTNTINNGTNHNIVIIPVCTPIIS